MKYISLFIFLFISVAIHAQTTKQELFDTPEKAGGVYYAYPEKDIKKQTDPPKGYEAFYISHYGRHGSRYLINDSDYKWALDLFSDAHNKNALTPLGEDVFTRLQKVWEEAEGRGGDLSPLGVQQLRGIAERMYTSFPQIFNNKADLSARSTIVIRCVLSMDAFCERLKEFNPALQITRESSNKYMKYLNFHTQQALDFRGKDGGIWREEYKKFEQNHTRPERLVKSLFHDSIYVVKKVNPFNLMWALFGIAVDMQNIETKVTFFDLFEKEEIFDLWQCPNYRLYVCDATSAQNGGTLMMSNAKPLLENILESANKLISTKGNGATFRFGHDGNVVPLAALLHLENCYNSVGDPREFYKAWSDFKIVPMAANIQMVFFRNKNSDNILVKFLLNERETLIPPVKSDILPYYHWKDIETFYKSLLDS